MRQATAVLHHVADAEAAVVNLVASARPGGRILLIEPDFLPVSIAEPPEVRAFWQGWLACSTFLAQCADPAWWTQTIAFTAVDGRAPAAE
jgi:2-polyprenyl-3-methyl-5-hydroxy-6-metoxy-1,4-benzoquinol methylase